MGDVILGIFWLALISGLVVYYVVSRRRRRTGHEARARAEHEHTINESRAAGHSRPDIDVRGGYGGGVG